MNYLVIDIGGTYTKYALMTENCEFLFKDKITTIRAPLDKFIDSIVGIYEIYKNQVRGIALSMPGVIDSKNGFMYTGGSIDCIANINIVEVLSRRCNVPITVGNDAKCAALAELWKGSLVDCQNAVVMVCGTGIGGAIIQDRKVISGKHFMAGEFSYPIINNQEPLCLDQAFGFAGGIGTLIKLVSQRTGTAEKELTGELIFNRANSGETAVAEAIREHARTIALQINNFQFILDPDKIAIGGGISIQPLFLQLIKEELVKINRIYEQWNLPLPEVVSCKFCNDANLIGALYIHIRANEIELDEQQVRVFLDLVKDQKEGQNLIKLLSKEE